MSGGSLDYAYHKVYEFAGEIRCRSKNDVLHLAFADHLDLVAKALHDLEWVLSGDKSPGDEAQAIRAVMSQTAEIDTARDLAIDVLHKLETAIKNSERK